MIHVRVESLVLADEPFVIGNEARIPTLCFMVSPVRKVCKAIRDQRLQHTLMGLRLSCSSMVSEKSCIALDGGFETDR